jgi:hypothetical protein
MTRKDLRKKLGIHRDPGQQEFARAKKQAREKTQRIHPSPRTLQGPRRQH